MRRTLALCIISLCFGILALAPRGAWAHCDTIEGPVVADARKALAKNDVTPVLKWVTREHEEEVRAAFKKTVEVRVQSSAAKELADKYFFETLVRIHRAGEGEPFTGLKPAGAKLEPGVAEADGALESGSADTLVKNVTEAIEKGIRERFNNAIEKKKHADKNIRLGREYVEAYVEFIHYIEGLHAMAKGPIHSGEHWRHLEKH